MRLFIGEPTFADAILDRIVHHAYFLDDESLSKHQAHQPTPALLDRNQGK